MTFSFVKKKEEYILGYLPSYGVYECRLKDVEKNYENNGEDSFSFKWGGYIFTKLQAEPDAYNYLRFKIENFYLDFAGLSARTNIKGYDEMSVHLFDIPMIKKGIENVIKYASEAKMDDKEQQDGDLRVLGLFLDKLKFYEGKETLVSCWLD